MKNNTNNLRDKKSTKKDSLGKFRIKFFSICFLLISFIILISSLVGSGFTVAYNNYSTAKANSYKLEIQAEIIDYSNHSTPKELNEFVYEQLEYYGYYGVDVETIGNDQIALFIPLSEIVNIEDQTAPFSYDDQRALLSFSSLISAVLFYHGPLEVKTIDGQNFFAYDNSGNVAFNDGENGTPGLVPPEDTPTVSVNNTPSSEMPVTVFDHAYVDYRNGQTYIQLQPVNNNIYNEIQNGMNYLIQNAQNVPEALNVTFWLGYDLYEELVIKYDNEGYVSSGNDLYTYAHTDKYGIPLEEGVRPSAKPFLVLDTKIPYTAKLKPYVRVDGNHIINIQPDTISLSPKEANFLVSRINYTSSNVQLNPISSKIILVDNSNLTLKVLGYLFLIFIVLTAIFMCWYLGLLGFINSAWLSVFILSFLAIASAGGIPFSIFFLTTFAFAFCVISLLSIEVITIFKYRRDQNATAKDKFKLNFQKIMKKYSFVFILSFIFLGMLGFFAPNFISVFVYYFLVLLVITYLYTIFFLPLILFFLDYLINFSKMKKTKKWNWILGTSKTFDFNIKFIKENAKFLNKKATSKTKFKAFSIFLVILASFFGLIIVISLFNQPVVHNTNDFRNYYQYNLVWNMDYVDDTKAYTVAQVPDNEKNTNNGGMSEEDPFDQLTLIEGISSDEMLVIVEDSFASESIDIDTISFYRNDFLEYETVLNPDTQSEEIAFSYSFAYGIRITTTEKASSQQLISLDQTLKQAEYPVINTWANDNDPFTKSETDTIQTTGYLALEETGSYYGDEAVSIHLESTYIASKEMFLALIWTLFLVFFILSCFLRWTSALAIFGSVFFESVFLFSLFVIFWIPFGFAFFVALSTYVLLSILTKVFLIKEPVRDLNKNKFPDIEQFKVDFRKNLTTFAMFNFYLFFGFFICSIFITFLTFAIYLPFLIFGFFGMFVLFFANNYFFYKITLSLTDFRNKVKLNDYHKRIKANKDKENKEEYIEGVNC